MRQSRRRPASASNSPQPRNAAAVAPQSMDYQAFVDQATKGRPVPRRLLAATSYSELFSQPGSGSADSQASPVQRSPSPAPGRRTSRSASPVRDADAEGQHYSRRQRSPSHPAGSPTCPIPAAPAVSSKAALCARPDPRSKAAASLSSPRDALQQGPTAAPATEALSPENAAQLRQWYSGARVGGSSPSSASPSEAGASVQEDRRHHPLPALPPPTARPVEVGPAEVDLPPRLGHGQAAPERVKSSLPSTQPAWGAAAPSSSAATSSTEQSDSCSLSTSSFSDGEMLHFIKKVAQEHQPGASPVSRSPLHCTPSSRVGKQSPKPPDVGVATQTDSGEAHYIPLPEKPVVVFVHRTAHAESERDRRPRRARRARRRKASPAPRLERRPCSQSREPSRARGGSKRAKKRRSPRRALSPSRMETLRREIRHELAQLVARQREGPVEELGVHHGQGAPLQSMQRDEPSPPPSAAPYTQQTRRRRQKRQKRHPQPASAATPIGTGRRQPELSMKARTKAALFAARY